MVKRKIVWDQSARIAFRETHNYIKKDSVEQAEKVRIGVVASIKELMKYPQMYAPDKYRTDKDLRFRAYEIYSYRISYFVAEDTIRILRFRHVKQEPKEY